MCYKFPKKKARCICWRVGEILQEPKNPKVNWNSTLKCDMFSCHKTPETVAQVGSHKSRVKGPPGFQSPPLAELFSCQLFPSCLRLFLPRYRTSHFHVMNLRRLYSSQFSHPFNHSSQYHLWTCWGCSVCHFPTNGDIEWFCPHYLQNTHNRNRCCYSIKTKKTQQD